MSEQQTSQVGEENSSIETPYGDYDGEFEQLTVENIQNQEQWVGVIDPEAEHPKKVKANGKEPEFGLSGSAYDEMKEYAQTNPEAIDTIGFLKDGSLYTGSSEEIVEKVNGERRKQYEEKQEQHEQKKNAYRELTQELSEEQLETLYENDLVVEFHESNTSYDVFATVSDEIQAGDQVISSYTHADDRYTILPKDVSVTLKNGQYHSVHETEQGKQLDAITNFRIDVNTFLETDSGTKLSVDIVPKSPAEETTTKIIDMEVFNETRDFKKSVCVGRTTTFNGSARYLNGIKELVGHQDAPTRKGVSTVGMHDGEMVTPNGVIGKSWEKEDPDHTFEPLQQAIESKWTLDIEGDGEYDSESVQEVFTHLWQSRDAERFLPLLGYFFSSLYAPSIRDIEGEIPLATVMANTGAGKTSVLSKLYEMIGLDGNPYSAKDTKFALMNSLASTNNVPIWMDEYKPSDMAKYEIDNLQDFLRKTTKKGDETRGQSDQSVRTYTLESPVILSGEETIQGSAEERRAIRTQLKTSVTKDGTEHNRHWVQLDGGSYSDGDGVQYCEAPDVSESAKAIWQHVIQNLLTTERWRDCRKEVYDTLEEVGIIGISDLEITALTMIQYGVQVHNEIAHENGVEEENTPSTDDIETAIEYIARKMGEGNRTSHVDEFIEVLGRAIEEGYLKSLDKDPNHGDFTVVHEGESNEQIRIKIDKAHNAVSKFVKEYDIQGVDLLDSHKDYRKRMKDDVQYIGDTSKYTRNLGRCVSIKTFDAEAVVSEFERGQINPQYYDSEEENEEPFTSD
ncbi:hypothetical protein [Halorubrum distributum]|uniref:hypothetical protein n=1 Tax=Halorubrum distributum TaxID=29283 RepID=UPI000A5B7375|nr:hypothetical protein [Halorubrum arcis]